MALVALLAAPGVAQGASLSRKIERVFREGSQGGGTWALVVRPLDGEGGGKERFEANASLRMIAASTCKLFVCHAAAAMLPPETSFVMTVSRSWVVSGRVARGSVQIDGGGAPGLASFGNGVDSGRGIFDAFAKAVRLAGVDSLAVRLCIRNDLFNPGDSIGAGWQWDDLPWYYAARVTATALDDNACRFRN